MYLSHLTFTVFAEFVLIFNMLLSTVVFYARLVITAFGFTDKDVLFVPIKLNKVLKIFGA